MFPPAITFAFDDFLVRVRLRCQKCRYSVINKVIKVGIIAITAPLSDNFS